MSNRLASFIILIFSVLSLRAQLFIPFSYWRCQTLGTTVSNSTSSDFSQGTFSNTNVSGNSVVLSTGNTSGTYTSKVFDLFAGCTPKPWSELSWVTDLPYGKEIPASSEVATDYANITTGLTTNLEGLWHFNETSGTSFADSSGNSNTGTKQGTVTLGTTGRLLNAISPNGSSGYVSTNIGTYNLSVFTIAIWFRTTTTRGGKLIGFGNSKTGSSSNYDRHIYMSNSGTLYFGVYPGSVKTVNTSASYNDGNWHQAVASLSGAGMKLYVDGDLLATNASVTSAQSYSGYVRIGFDNVNGWTNKPTSYYFSGDLDEAAMWSRALSDTEVAQLFQRGGNRIKFQVKSCTQLDCSDIASWVGPDGTNSTYFSEVYNNSIQSTGLGNVLTTSPDMLFSNFSSMNLPVYRYFQYQATFESDNTNYMPSLTSTIATEQ